MTLKRINPAIARREFGHLTCLGCRLPLANDAAYAFDAIGTLRVSCLVDFPTEDIDPYELALWTVDGSVYSHQVPNASVLGLCGVLITARPWRPAQEDDNTIPCPSCERAKPNYLRQVEMARRDA